jgi:signal transduction histidine kinase
MLTVEISDDGRGGARPTEGSGLGGLKDRVEALDGAFEVQSSDGAGTRIRADLPLRSEEARVPA